MEKDKSGRVIRPRDFVAMGGMKLKVAKRHSRGKG
jgi:hypothetical protein